ncbi:MAG: ATP-binding cassette domain-containing protein [Microbacterium sp.]|nr:ATP-binding cassette domain-containing protein [Microbacterium sp.]
MARGFQGAVLRGFGARDHLATVTGTERLAPQFLRVRLRSDTLFDEVTVEPTAWLRFWFPDPAGSTAEHQRAYTFTESDPETGEFAVDFVLHEPAGPASVWAQRATVGDSIAVMSLGSYRFEVPDEPPGGYLLVGDAASIPAINSILAVVPETVPIELYLEQHDPDDALIPLHPHPRLRSRWVPRGDGRDLAAAIESRDWSNWRAWVCAESATIRHAKNRLHGEFGFPKSEIEARAYWIRGRAMGTLRDEKPTPAPSEETPASSFQTPTPAEPAEVSAPPATVASAAAHARGSWDSQAAGHLLGPLRGRLIAAGIVQGLLTLLQLAPFALLVELSRLLLTGAEPGALWTLGVVALALMGGGALAEAGLMLWLHAVDAAFERDLRRRLLDKLARIPLGWFVDRGSARVKTLVQDDTLALHYLVTHAVVDAVAAVVAPVAVLVYLFVVDARLALLLLVPVLVYVVSMSVMMVRSGAKIGQAQRWTERLNDQAGAYLDGQRVVRVFGGAAGSAFRGSLDEYVRFLGEWQRPFTGAKTVMDLATRPTTFLWLIGVAGSLLVVGGTMDPLNLLPFLFLGTTFGARLLGVGYGLSGLRDGMLAARRISVALEEKELGTTSAARAAADAATVEFDGVEFAYRAGVPVLHGVSATLEPGTVTALVGASGSGKSTLAALLARFHDVTAGAVRIGGDDVRTLDADELYARVGFVFQDAQLVTGTVRDNIALARPDADDDSIRAAAAAAQLHERIERMPQGYDTPLGPDAALSGGERQRLTIARALLADTPVLVLDEATAFADPESEHLVQRALDELTRGRTVLVIAHRLHTVTGVDRILVLDDGRLVEQGTHAELVAASGAYRRLWDARLTHTSEVAR